MPVPKSKKKENRTDRISIRTNLINDDIEYFNDIHLKMAEILNKDKDEITKTDVIRKSIRFTHEFYGKEIVVVDPAIANLLQNLLKIPSIMVKYGNTNLQDLFNRYASEFIKENRKSLRDNLMEILPDLAPEHREIAIACTELDRENQTITLASLKKHTTLDEKSILESLNILTNRNYLEKYKYKGELRYTVL
jgi:hypothetical protein